MQQTGREFTLTHEQQETFTHKDDDGILRTFLVGNMQRLVRDYPTCVDLIPKRMKIERRTIVHIRKNMGIEPQRVKRMKEPYLSIPGIGILWPGSMEMTVIDGNHRMIKRNQNCMRYMNFFIFKHPFWENFLLPEDVQNRIMETHDLLNDPSGMMDFERKKL